jgi:hypothetical protein
MPALGFTQLPQLPQLPRIPFNIFSALFLLISLTDIVANYLHFLTSKVCPNLYSPSMLSFSIRSLLTSNVFRIDDITSLEQSLTSARDLHKHIVGVLACIMFGYVLVVPARRSMPVRLITATAVALAFDVFLRIVFCWWVRGASDRKMAIWRIGWILWTLRLLKIALSLERWGFVAACGGLFEAWDRAVGWLGRKGIDITVLWRWFKVLRQLKSMKSRTPKRR